MAEKLCHFQEVPAAKAVVWHDLPAIFLRLIGKNMGEKNKQNMLVRFTEQIDRLLDELVDEGFTVSATSETAFFLASNCVNLLASIEDYRAAEMPSE